MPDVPSAAKVTFRTLVGKTVVMHTLTYFLCGWLALTLLDYGRTFALPELAGLMRPTDHPLVMAGPLFQPLRGLLFAVAFYPLRHVLFDEARGWLTLWLLLAVIGIFSTYGPSPGSIEGLIYTRLPIGFQLVGLIEVLLQSLVFSIGLCAWVRHPLHWATWVLIGLFTLALALPIIGLVVTGAASGL